LLALLLLLNLSDEGGDWDDGWETGQGVWHDDGLGAELVLGLDGDLLDLWETRPWVRYDDILVGAAGCGVAVWCAGFVAAASFGWAMAGDAGVWADVWLSGLDELDGAGNWADASLNTSSCLLDLGTAGWWAAGLLGAFLLGT